MDAKATKRRLQEAEETPIDYDWEKLRLERHSHEVQKLADKLGIDLNEPDTPAPTAPPEPEGPGFWNRTGEFVSNLGKSFAELGEGAVRLLTETPLSTPLTPEAKAHQEAVTEQSAPQRKAIQEAAHVPIDIASEAVDYYSEGDPSWWSKLGSDILSESVFPGSQLKKVEGVWPLLKEGSKLIPWNVGLQGAREFSQLPENPTADDYATMAKRLGITGFLSPLIGAPMAKYLGKADDVGRIIDEVVSPDSISKAADNIPANAAGIKPSATPEEILSKPPTIKNPQPVQVQKAPPQVQRGDMQLPKGNIQGKGGDIMRGAEPPMDPVAVPRHFLPEEANAEIALRTIKAKDDLAAGATDKTETLTAFIRSHGGLQDQGGELSHIGIDDARKPFEKKLAREDGMTLDQAAELAHEAGLLDSRDINLLLDSLDSESRGLTSKTPQWFDDATKGPGKLTPERVRVALDKIEKDKGLDVGRDVEKVKEALLNDPDFVHSPYAPKTEADWEEAIKMVTPERSPIQGIQKGIPEEGADDLVPDEMLDDLFPEEAVDDVTDEALEEVLPALEGKGTANMSPDEALKYALAKARAAKEPVKPEPFDNLASAKEAVYGKKPFTERQLEAIRKMDEPETLPKPFVENLGGGGGKKSGYERWFEKMAKRHAMEDAGQEILDELEETGRAVGDVVDDFWINTYPHLPKSVQKKFMAMVDERGGPKLGYVRDGIEGEYDLLSNEIRPREFFDLADEVEYLEGTDRGFVALMEEANRRFAQAPRYADEVTDVIEEVPKLTSAADEAMANVKPQTMGERGAVVMGKQAPPQQASPFAFRDPNMEQTFQKGREAMDTPSFFDRVYEGFQDLIHGFSRTFKHLPNTPQFSRANEYLSQLKHAPRYGAERAIRVMRGIVDDLTPDEFDLFERLIIMQDANFDAMAGKTLPDGWTPQGVANELQRLQQLGLQNPKVQNAMNLRFRMINQLREELTDAKILNIDPNNVNPHYFPHIVRDYAEEAIKQAESGGGLSIKKKTPWYAKSRQGTNKLYNFNYLEAESAYLQKAYTDLQTAHTIKALRNEYDIVPKLQKAARDWNAANPGKPPRTWEDMPLPKGYDTYVVDPSATFYSAFSTGEHAIDQQIAGLADALAKDQNLALTLLQGASADDMLEVLATLRPTKVLGRPKAPMVIPDELKKTLVELGRGQKNGWYRKLNGAFKEWLLIAPHKVLRYNINNLIGDMEAVWVGNSKIMTDGQLGSSVSELWNIVRGKTGPTADYLDALRLGVIDTGQITTELTDPNSFSALMRIDPRSNASWGKMAEDLIKRGWGSIRKWNQFRENMLRYGAYKHYKRVLDAGESFSYGASKKELVDVLPTNAEKAGKMARELLGDYAAVSEHGQAISRDVMMFYRWMEVNTTRYSQVFQNTAQEAQGNAGSKAAVIVASKLAKLMTWMTMVSMWNKYIIGEDWEKLPKHARAMPNVVMPMYRDENGMPRYIRTEGSFADLMKTYGFDDIREAVEMTANGEMSMGEALKEITLAAPMSVLERVGTGSYPAIIGTAEVLTNKSFWPDAEHPREITDWGRHLSEKVGLKHGHDLLFGRKDFNPEDAILDTFSYKPSDRTDYYESRNEASDWKDRKGGGRYSGSPSDDPDRKTIYQWIDALKKDDQEALEELKPLVAAIITSDKGKYKRIMDDLDPALAINLGTTKDSKYQREEFLKSLNPEQRRRYDRALEQAKAIRNKDPFRSYTVPQRSKAASRHREIWGF